MTSLLSQAAGAATGALLGVFGYNRENYQNDRRQRLLMEMQTAEMRIAQAGLWREDVRSVMELTPRKMEVYLLVIAIELNASACALCKARVPPGSPAWLAVCHTLAICTAIMYLFLGLWFGLHAFVAAQAYKVRILTQIVRLPVPTWQHLEASRTYASSFEKLGANQMLRVPIIQGSQESHCGRPPAAAAAGPAAGAAAGDAEGAAAAALARFDREAMLPCDPWGLERSGSNMSELQPGVNSSQLEQQQHIWHAREAARFYQTYDAFCRVCMSAGTSSLASFFAFFCLSYVLTENAAPVAAWAGVLVFSAIGIILIGTDLKCSRSQFVKATVLHLTSPVLCCVVTFVSSKNYGDPGKWEWLMPVALFNKGLWFLYYLHLLRVKEMETGAVLPTSFKGVLYLDPFGWAKHSMKGWRRIQSRVSSVASLSRTARSQGAASTAGDRPSLRLSQPSEVGVAPPQVQRLARRSTIMHAAGMAFASSDRPDSEASSGPPSRGAGGPRRRISLSGFVSRRLYADPLTMDVAIPEDLEAVHPGAGEQLPSMVCVDTTFPSRPEDAVTSGEPARTGDRPRVESAAYIPNISFRPTTFAPGLLDESSDTTAEPAQTGSDIHGEIPGLVPWRYFFINTLVVASLWFVGSGISVYNAWGGRAVFVQPTYGLSPGQVAPLPLLVGERIATGWHDVSLERPRGLACDASGAVFLTAGRDAGGRRTLLHGRLSSSPASAGAAASRSLDRLALLGGSVAAPEVTFAPSSACRSAAGDVLGHPQDLALRGDCGPPPADDGNGTKKGGVCLAVVLPRRGERLVHCPLDEAEPAAPPVHVERAVGRSWLEDRGGEPEDEEEARASAGLLLPEELSALTTAPCAHGGASSAGRRGDGSRDEDCVVVATSARRVLLLGAANGPPSAGAAPALPQLVPRRLFRNDHGTVPGPGSLALLQGRFLGVLDHSTSSLHVLDLHMGGRRAGSWRLPGAQKPSSPAHQRRFSALCAGGGAFFGLEDSDNPSLWRFPAPVELLRAA
mmetsp:Transcript_52155/g.169404  ORF Transcript_52155/g.169404 Transcript_52155/m.169404 type:complete len:1017 (+) Transcript_52155:196-3246(+)